MKLGDGSCCMWVFFVGVVLILLSVLVSGDQKIADCDTMIVTVTSRRHLKDNGDGRKIDKGHDDTVSLEDYRPYDASPSSKASVRPAPIQHGTPLMPYIPNPKPSPPTPSGHP